jgi:hypothetical protein
MEGREPKDTPLHVKIPASLKRRLERRAVREDRSEASIVRIALENYCDRLDPPRGKNHPPAAWETDEDPETVQAWDDHAEEMGEHG